MATITNSMDNLYNIFCREKERVGDSVTVFYNKNKNSLQYKDEEGTLTVLFKPVIGGEDIYYRSNDSKNAGYGTLVQRTTENGVRGKLYREIFDIPQKFIDIAQAYQYERDEIGVEKKQKSKAKLIERD